MDDAPFTNREIVEWRTGVKIALDAILEQTQKTNGRVDKLENWRSYISGGVSVIVVLLVPILLLLLSQHV